MVVVHSSSAPPPLFPVFPPDQQDHLAPSQKTKLWSRSKNGVSQGNSGLLDRSLTTHRLASG
eukprot:2301896-Amphidinium_carterae.3